MTSVSVIVPTYQEAENLPALVKRIEPLREKFQDLELIIVDDNSNDGTSTFINNRSDGGWIRLFIRKNERGLSSAVIHGIKNARNDVIVVMDADLSHPPEKIPEMVSRLNEPLVDFVLGSRYIKGGKTSADWTVFRWINSKVATIMARPFTNIKDPMSGFFCLKKATFDRAENLNPIGYKIGLELIVKCRCKNVIEIPILFQERVRGNSKLCLKEQLNYFRHIGRLTAYKLGHIFSGSR